jgi:hypothetical protein
VQFNCDRKQAEVTLEGASNAVPGVVAEQGRAAFGRQSIDADSIPSAFQPNSFSIKQDFCGNQDAIEVPFRSFEAHSGGI